MDLYNVWCKNYQNFVWTTEKILLIIHKNIQWNVFRMICIEFFKNIIKMNAYVYSDIPDLYFRMVENLRMFICQFWEASVCLSICTGHAPGLVPVPVQTAGRWRILQTFLRTHTHWECRWTCMLIRSSGNLN